MLFHIITWGVFALGLIFCIVALFVTIQDHKKKSICTEKIHAEIIAVEKETQTDQDHHISYTTVTPIYRYTFQGQVYERASSLGYPESKVKPGDVRYIYINPDNPREIRDDSNLVSVLVYIFTAIGAVFVIGSLVIRHFIKF